MSRRLTILAPLLTLLVLLGGTASAQAALSFKWGHPIRLEPFRYGGLDTVSCPNTQLCVAGDARGDVVTTQSPRSGRWSAPQRVDGASITSVSCPTDRFCAAVDSAGSIITSADPAGGSREWTRAVRIDTSLSAGGGWAGLASISCPSADLCVAVDNAAGGNSNVLYSTDPSGGRASWHSSALTGQARSVSCSSTSLCIIAGSTRWVSTTPTVATSWQAATPTSGQVYESVDCLGAHLCIGVGYGNTTPGFSAGTRNATGTWGADYQVEAMPPPAGSGLVDSVSCTRGTCVAVDGLDNAFITSQVANGVWGAGAPIRSGSISQWNAISCTSGLCVVVDSAGVETTGVS